ncbi:MAG: hypothetical protein ACUVTB_07530 [Candidatus Bathycorpusculaceae bacterium]
MNDNLTIKRHFSLKVDKFIVGGLHLDDFERASRQHEENGYVLVAFLLDCDGYHWKAIYVKAGQLEKALEADIFGAKYS